MDICIGIVIFDYICILYRLIIIVGVLSLYIFTLASIELFISVQPFWSYYCIAHRFHSNNNHLANRGNRINNKLASSVVQ